MPFQGVDKLYFVEDIPVGGHLQSMVKIIMLNIMEYFYSDLFF